MGCFYGRFIHINEVVMWFINKIIVIIIIIIIIIIITTTLRQLLTNVKDRDEPNNRQGAVYKIKCSDFQASYIVETGRD